MKLVSKLVITGIVALSMSCGQKTNETEQEAKEQQVTAEDILGNPDYLAISYGGYRQNSRDDQPTIAQLKEDLIIMHAMGIRVLRTYNVHFPHAANLLKAISELKKEDPDFEMYVMLGAWIDCKDARTEEPDHNAESERNEVEIGMAVELANEYPDIVKILAVGNEAMVTWQALYYVQPEIILKWVNHLQELKKAGELPEDLWITCSDDFASWGGGDESYHKEGLNQLIKAVDYISIHTYPYHSSHYNPAFWIIPEEELEMSDIEKVNAAMDRSMEYAKSQYKAVSDYVKSLGVEKPIHIGETGWSTISNGFYGAGGSRATDEYKQGEFHKKMRKWTNESGIACFYFEAFDEKWKDSGNPLGSENHFGLFTIDGQAKYPIWNLVDEGIFDGMTRGGNPIIKTYGGVKDSLMKEVLPPPVEYGETISE